MKTGYDWFMIDSLHWTSGFLLQAVASSHFDILPAAGVIKLSQSTCLSFYLQEFQIDRKALFIFTICIGAATAALLPLRYCHY